VQKKQRDRDSSELVLEAEGGGFKAGDRAGSGVSGGGGWGRTSRNLTGR